MLKVTSNVYGDLRSKLDEGGLAYFDYLRERAILAPLNVDVAAINRIMTNRLVGDSLISVSLDTPDEL